MKAEASACDEIKVLDARLAVNAKASPTAKLKHWRINFAKVTGFKKACIAVASKLAVILHAMWKTNMPFR